MTYAFCLHLCTLFWKTMMKRLVYFFLLKQLLSSSREVYSKLETKPNWHHSRYKKWVWLLKCQKGKPSFRCEGCCPFLTSPLDPTCTIVLLHLLLSPPPPCFLQPPGPPPSSPEGAGQAGTYEAPYPGIGSCGTEQLSSPGQGIPHPCLELSCHSCPVCYIRRESGPALYKSPLIEGVGCVRAVSRAAGYGSEGSYSSNGEGDSADPKMLPLPQSRLRGAGERPRRAVPLEALPLRKVLPYRRAPEDHGSPEGAVAAGARCPCQGGCGIRSPRGGRRGRSLRAEQPRGGEGRPAPRRQWQRPGTQGSAPTSCWDFLGLR